MAWGPPPEAALVSASPAMAAIAVKAGAARSEVGALVVNLATGLAGIRGAERCARPTAMRSVMRYQRV